MSTAVTRLLLGRLKLSLCSYTTSVAPLLPSLALRNLRPLPAVPARQSHAGGEGDDFEAEERKGEVATLEPFCVPLRAGKTYHWCRCGRSKKQPFCDGSHKGSEWTPVRLRLEEDEEEAWLCGCKQTDTPPYCDGSHALLPPPSSSSS